jgi:predicted phage terminase large subunit-like protein
MPPRSPFGAIADVLENDWRILGRPEQIEPEGAWWTIWAYVAGRGAGKTRAGAETVREWVESGRCGRVGLIAPTQADARDVLLEGESGLLNVCGKSAWSRPGYQPSRRRVEWPNGAIATLYSAEEPERLRGPQHDGLWCDELAVWKNAQAVWDTAMLGLRLGKRPRAIVTTTPRPIPLLRGLLKREGKDVAVSRGRTRDNAENLAPAFLSEIVGRYTGTRLGRQELDGELLEDVPGALWSRDLIEETRRERAGLPPLKRVVVALDPAVSVGEVSDETGIIVAGVGVDGEGYVLEDASGKMAPVEWARRAVGLYRKWSADRIVAEANQGGAMVETTIRTIDPNVSFVAVRASKAKITRAEPISALFEQRRAHLVGIFPELEDQMATYAAGSPGSPDRLDAMAWAITELMVLAPAAGMGFYEYLRREHEKMHGAERMVRLHAPASVASVVRLMSGRLVAVPADRIVEMGEADARPLVQWAGWRPAEGEDAPPDRSPGVETPPPARRSVAELAAAAGGVVTPL